ncbi:MAG TPA: 2Fe-2S iron-sulfur cluster-binding protein [Candidatus Aminicenantes bacterium]|nr:2Fe-2S iron-sulfur cluster-binding protein [Candidatus Aminicenantes bacterium]
MLSSAALLERNPAPSLPEIRSALSGHICRCGNYVKIYDAVATAASRMKARKA